MIFQNAIWQFSEYDKNAVESHSKHFGCDPIVSKLLLERGIEEETAVKRFLSPQIKDLYDPFLMSDMQEAVERIRVAMDAHESIWIYGDYDVDGITSISILTRCFEFLGVSVSYYIPDRQDEGYGISNTGLDAIKASGGRLVITVDCGITAVAESVYAKEIGLDLIITDHHEPQENLPEAIAVVNPKLGEYPFRMLAGCGVAFKLAQALTGENFERLIPNIIDIAALGTIADIVPLVDENRILAYHGLKQMQQSKNPGIRALIAEAGLKGKTVDAGHIGFVIAPRINATGRIGNPRISVTLLLEKEERRALEIAAELTEINAERQSREREIMEEAERYIDAHIDLAKERVLLVVGENWHTGIIGIVASKLSDKFSRPSVVLNRENGILKGSARSIDGISIFEVLSHFKGLFDKFGGHEQAAGLTLPESNFEAFKSGLRAYGLSNIPEYMLIGHYRVSGQLKPNMVTHQLVESIDALKPFGMGNPKPQFVFENLTLDDYKRIGKQQNHLKMIVSDGGRVYDAIAFNRGDSVQFLRRGDRIHLLFNLELNQFMGVETLQFLVKGLTKDRLPMPEGIKNRAANAIYTYLMTCSYKENEGAFDSKFTMVPSFDIIFSAMAFKPLAIYSMEALEAFKDYVLNANILRYTLHFNTINPMEQRPGYLDVVFMPLQTAEDSWYRWEKDQNEHLAVQHIPKREDLVYVYKRCDCMGETLVTMSEKLRMDPVKVLFCMDLFEETALFKKEIRNGRYWLTRLPKPEKKLDLGQNAAYAGLLTKWHIEA
ncbi:MAG: single-stranded-DNA-specific exonuclease [Clostridiales bacterium]|jgi:single-stranded-DNA-specific exonuclease|nr:single-stranded-DNA-specific exonuclease [Clostridiales bacterium]